MSNIETKNKTVLPGTYQQLVSTPKTGIKIVPKYHQYDNRFFGWKNWYVINLSDRKVYNFDEGFQNLFW